VGRRRHHRAGESALRHWRAERLRTVRREWRLWASGTIAAAAIAVYLPFAHGVGQLILAAVLGSVVTTLVVGWLIGGDVQSLSWLWGSYGEQRTEDVLAPLERLGWRVVHDIPHARGNWDHVVVGHGGVFLLDTKTSGRRAAVREDRLFLGRTTFSGGGFRAAAKALHSSLAASHPPFIHAVVALWADFPARHHEERDVVYIDGRLLPEWLAACPTKLPPTRVTSLGDAVEQLRMNAVAG
jgi:nuclease-like protein